MMTKVAWYVTDDEECHAVVFENTCNQARAIAARLFEYDEIEPFNAQRKPEYDQYSALGYVPPSVLIKDDWVFNCSWCDTRVDEENEQLIPEEDVDEEEESGYELEDSYYHPTPVFQGKDVFCCQAHFEAEQEAIAAVELRREEARSLLLSRYPKAQNLKVTGGWKNDPIYAEFGFGGAGNAFWTSSKEPETVSILASDKDAWEAWRA